MFKNKLIAARKEEILSLRKAGITGLNFKTKKAKTLDAFKAVIEARLAEIEAGNIQGDIIFFVPLEYLHPVAKMVKKSMKSHHLPKGTHIFVGTQRISPEFSFVVTDSKEEAEHTGESVSARFVDPVLGVSSALVAHSETLDPDAVAKDSVKAIRLRAFNSARHLSITTVAVGETSEQRKAGPEVYIPEVQTQLVERLELLTAAINHEVLRKVPARYRDLVFSESYEILELLEEGKIDLVIAYEPIWSIGERAVGEATPQEAREMLIPMFETLVGMFGLEIALKIRFQYGGSLNAEKAPDFANIEEIYELPDGRRVKLFYHGGLVGGAAYKEGAGKIAEAFNKVK